jgi:glycosyltransferase involved in cell wall biosynthesis
MMLNRTTDIDEQSRPVSIGKPPAFQPACRSTQIPVIRVALVVEAAGGGVAVHIADLIQGLCALGGVDIHLVVPSGARFDKTIISDNILAQCGNVHWVPMQRAVGSSDMVAFARLFGLLNRIKPDIVHSHSSKAGALARLCIGPWKQVYTAHAVYTLNPYLPRAQRRFYGLIEHFLGRIRSDRVIAVSIDEAKHLQHALRIPAHRIETIFNGVPAPALLPAAEARAALGLPLDAVIVGFVGRLDFQKGVDRLARVAQRLLDDGIDNVIFALIGPGDFAAVAGLNQQAAPANLRVLGLIPNARCYFSAFDIFALPSRYEGFPYVVLEALSAGVPIISTRVSGAAELIEAEQIGFVVPNEDDTAVFSEATAALAQDEELRGRMSRNCKRATERFSVATMVRRTVDLYRRLLAEAV